mmetsp:Transcript_112526/g.195418  ORF Transcript_112526/g.195418 Transcript_112526/m.195418 type:complete len:228 (-) Transcript_112526:619-1302(-)
MSVGGLQPGVVKTTSATTAVAEGPIGEQEAHTCSVGALREPPRETRETDIWGRREVQPRSIGGPVGWGQLRGSIHQVLVLGDHAPPHIFLDILPALAVLLLRIWCRGDTLSCICMGPLCRQQPKLRADAPCRSDLLLVQVGNAVQVHRSRLLGIPLTCVPRPEHAAWEQVDRGQVHQVPLLHWGLERLLSGWWQLAPILSGILPRLAGLLQDRLWRLVALSDDGRSP